MLRLKYTTIFFKTKTTLKINTTKYDFFNKAALLSFQYAVEMFLISKQKYY